LRVWIDLDAGSVERGVRVANATGESEGRLYMIHDAPLVSGAHADLTIEFDIPEPVTMPSPVYAAEVVSTGAPPNPEEPVTVDGATLLPNGTLALEFNTISNRVYYVKHSAEMSGWNTILPPIAGTEAGSNGSFPARPALETIQPLSSTDFTA
jgi:hypothetical protein